MSWTNMLEEWNVLMHAFVARFPHCDPAALRRFRGNRDLLVTYLADTHELTEAEACAVLTDWLAHSAPRAAMQAAA
ncbi:MAG: hypothetical protein AAFY38_01395 [Pseudomonadota bacterium]